MGLYSRILLAVVLGCACFAPSAHAEGCDCSVIAEKLQPGPASEVDVRDLHHFQFHENAFTKKRGCSALGSTGQLVELKPQDEFKGDEDVKECYPQTADVSLPTGVPQRAVDDVHPIRF